MKAEHLALATENLRKRAALSFGMAPQSLKVLDGFENIVFEAEREGRPCILRLSHSTHRNPGQVHSEQHWVEYLAQNDVAVCRPIRSVDNHLTEYFDTTNGGFTVAAFERAPGEFVRREDQTPAMAWNRGRLIGRMHALTRRYQPPAELPRRSHWHEDGDFVHFHDYLKSEDRVIGERLAEVIAELKKLPTDQASYGLIHMDAHTGNTFFDGDRPTLFDFDDSSYDFFISDIAIVLFYAVLNLPADWDRTEYARDFLRTFLEGYREEHRLEASWREVIPTILKRREILLYVAIYRGFDEADFDQWCHKYLNERRPRIADRTPYLDLDWSEFDLG